MGSHSPSNCHLPIPSRAEIHDDWAVVKGNDYTASLGMKFFSEGVVSGLISRTHFFCFRLRPVARDDVSHMVLCLVQAPDNSPQQK